MSVMISRNNRLNDTILTQFYCYRDEESDEMKLETRKLKGRLDAMGVRYKSLYIGCDGSCWLNLSGTIIADISPLKHLPVTHLCLQGCYQIADFAPLKDMQLHWLNLSRTRITNLHMLSKLPLAHLKLYRTWTTSLLSLKETPLISLDIRFAGITDLSPLKRTPLQELSFFPGRIKKGLHSLRGIKTLKKINRRPATDFWQRYGKWPDSGVSEKKRIQKKFRTLFVPPAAIYELLQTFRENMTRNTDSLSEY
jgi:hypothetical protein